MGIIEPLAYYTVELARPRDGWGRLQKLTVRARQASQELEREGGKVRFLRSIFVPEDDTCLFLYEAPSVELVREAAARAVLEVGRVAETISDQDTTRERTR